MNINTKVINILDDYKIHKANAICYLISLYYGYEPDYIPDSFKMKMNTTRIYEMDKNNSLQWNVPLFDEQKTKFEWVKSEYVALFENANQKKRGNGNDAVRRMKRFFVDNPDIRKEEILGATKMYLMNTSSDYIRLSHYFIYKGKGLEFTSDLLEWVDKYRISKQSTGTSITNRMQ